MVTSGNREPNSSLRTDSKSSGSFHKIRRLFPRRRAVHQRDATQAAQAPENEHGVTDKTADGHLATSSVSAAQDQTSSIKNERWREKRAEFCDLLKELRQHFVLFSQEVEPKQSKSVAAGLLETAQADSELIRYRSGGDKLQALIQCLRKKPQQSHMAFQLLLQSDPFDFRSTLSSISPTCKDHFQEESAAFYLRLSLEKGSSTMADTALLSSATSQITDPEFKFFVFDVSHKSEASKVGTEIDDLRLLFEPKTTQPETDDWATFYGHVGENVRVISDSTIHLPQQSFAGCLIDCAEKDILRKPAYAGMRAELAFVVASSLFYNLQAEGLHDVDATELHYYTAFNDKKQEPDYVESRILPYVSLNTLGSTTVSPSSSDALSRATKSDLEERMMKKLGILIYEIGAWDRVIRRELQERVTHVTDAKEFLREEISSKYRDVIHACLAYKKSDDIGKWMIQNVILPLEEVYKSIKSGELRF